MRFSIFTAIAMISFATARKCGTGEPSQGLIQASNAIMAASSNDFSIAKTRTPIRVPTYFHVLRYGLAEKEGNIPDSQLKAQVLLLLSSGINSLTRPRQLDVLNKDYEPAGISFVLKDTTRTTNSDWYHDQDESAMKKALRKGNYGTLNVYFQDLSGITLGYCYFPQPRPDKDIIRTDGCSVLSTTLPGGNTTNYNLGRTLTQ